MVIVMVLAVTMLRMRVTPMLIAVSIRDECSDHQINILRMTNMTEVMNAHDTPMKTLHDGICIGEQLAP